MAVYRISGIWKDKDNVITDYAFHKVSRDGASRAERKTKSEAIDLLELNDNTATTWVWNYKSKKWNIGENVSVVNGSSGKYLRSDPDNTLTDNLEHLIDYDWLSGKCFI